MSARIPTLLSLTAIILTLTCIAAAAATPEKLVIHIYHARLGPVYQRLPDGRVVELYADVYYPDTLYLRPPNILGTVNVTIYTNWTGLWDGIITVEVVDPGYQIDPTTFKPTNSMYKWAAGGATIGAGNILAPEGAIENKTSVTRSINLTAHLRYFRAKPGIYDAQYFFRIRVALFDPKTLEKIPGGDINMYTVSEGAPHVKIVVISEPEKRENSQIIPTQLLLEVSAAGAAAAAAYIAFDTYSRRRRA